ncbi:hypothetical protein ABVT39_007098 [Epinephelus coioides]
MHAVAPQLLCAYHSSASCWSMSLRNSPPKRLGARRSFIHLPRLCDVYGRCSFIVCVSSGFALVTVKMANKRERLLLELRMIDIKPQMLLLQMLQRREKQLCQWSVHPLNGSTFENGGAVVLQQEVKPCEMLEMM